MMSQPLLHDPLDLALSWAGDGQPAALATVIATWGSSPRPAGSMMAVGGGGRIEGSVSGGCVEASVFDAAMTAMQDGRHRLLSYGVTSDLAWSVGLACGGELDVLVQSVGPGGTLPLATLRAATDLRRRRKPALLATRLSDMHHVLVARTDGNDLADQAGGPIDPRLAPLLEQALRDGRSRRVTGPDDEAWFLHLLTAPHRLLIVGAVHIAQVLAPLAATMGFAVTVIDPRTQLATPDRFPGITLVTEWPDEALETLAIDTHTAIVTLTHDAKLDDPTLRTALGSPAFYIGALGSRRTQASRLDRLAAAGFGPDRTARIHGPVGLAIGAVGAPEIALSILAEIVAVRRDAPLGRHPGWT
ncbi:XdhC family protein [Gluconacetobacter sacchari]|uniref:XdhC family protein n=2 Tax=Gluconacetobacter sacchari TaxID=92759 RepID=A0A7W4NQG5_9PROT|nr:XdhC family protein [Gluconacetobacter sacchari]